MLSVVPRRSVSVAKKERTPNRRHCVELETVEIAVALLIISAIGIIVRSFPLGSMAHRSSPFCAMAYLDFIRLDQAARQGKLFISPLRQERNDPWYCRMIPPRQTANVVPCFTPYNGVDYRRMMTTDTNQLASY